MTARIYLIALAAAAATPAIAQQQPSVTLYTSIGPTIFSPVDGTIPNALYASPNLERFAGNAVTGIRGGVSTGDVRGDPGQFTISDRTVFSAEEGIQTEFNSWLGDASPAGAFAGEFGTNIRVSAYFLSETPFTSANIYASYANSDGVVFPPDPFFFFGDEQFEPRTVGIRWVNGRGGEDDIFYTTGDIAGVELNELVIVGSSIGALLFNETITEFGFANAQELLDAVIADINANPFTQTFGYELRNGDGATLASASSTVTIGMGAVPEPATWATMIAGFALIGGVVRRRADRTAHAINGG